MAEKCTHLGSIKEVTPHTPEGCEECLAVITTSGEGAALHHDERSERHVDPRNQ